MVQVLKNYRLKDYYWHITISRACLWSVDRPAGLKTVDTVEPYKREATRTRKKRPAAVLSSFIVQYMFKQYT